MRVRCVPCSTGRSHSTRRSLLWPMWNTGARRARSSSPCCPRPLTRKRRAMIPGIRSVLLVICVLSAATSDHPARPVKGVVAFEHVNVIPMDSERVLRDYTVVVRDGTISAVGPARRTALPAGAQRVDGTGKYLMPGLSDMHVHPYDTDQFINYLAHGITTITVLNGSPAVLRWRNAVLSGELLGPTIY